MAKVSLEEVFGSTDVPNRNGSETFLNPGAGKTAEQLVADIEQSNAPEEDKKAARAALEAGRVQAPASSKKVSLAEAFGKPAAPTAKPAEVSPEMKGLEAIQPTYFDPLAEQNYRELARAESVAPAPERGVLGALKGRGSLSPTGILKNLLTTSQLPRELRRMWGEESVLAHLNQANQQGRLGETLSQIANSPMVLAKEFPNFSYKEVWDAAKENPKAMMGGLIDSVVADPILAFVPWLSETRVARGLAVTGSRLGRAGEVAGRAAGRAVEIGGSAGAVVAPISVADQMATQGYVDPKQLVQDVGMGVGLGTAVAVATNLGGAILKIRPRELYNDWRQRVAKGSEPGPAMDEALRAAGMDREKAKDIGDAVTGAHEEQFAEAMMPKGQADPQLTKKEFAERKRMAAARLREEIALQEARQAGEAETATAQDAAREANRLANATPVERFPQTGANVLDPNVPPKMPLSVGVLLGSAEAARAKPGFARTAEDVLALRREARVAAERFAGLARTWSKDPRMQSAIVLGLSAPFWDEMSQEQLAGLGAAGAVLAVKPAGGMWHPEAVRRLSNAFNFHRSTPGGVPDAAGEAGANWADRAVRNYLNRYAGTDRDPLKDVRIPVGQEMKRWEEVTDVLVRGEPNKPGRFSADWQHRIPAGETVWGLGGRRFPDDPQLVSRETTTATNALTSHLSHVGDYLRANVQASPKTVEHWYWDKAPREFKRRFPEPGGNVLEAPEAESSAWFKAVRESPEYQKYIQENPLGDLAQYDLVRAVLETAANDEKVARQAAKDFGNRTAERVPAQELLPTYKSYGEVNFPARKYEINKVGSKQQLTAVDLPAERVTMEWKELALPAELTPEQAKGVRPVTEWGSDAEAGPTPGDARFQAVDAQGKPIKDNFSGTPAVGRTPQEAWLAGQLALEGNVMGHCVGTHCGDILHKNSRVISLRDSKGRSYATVQIDIPTNEISWLLDDPRIEQLLRDRGQYVPGQIIQDSQVRKAAIDLGIPAPRNISEIKGPGNGAPPSYVLPYVQDLVKGGKWGEVKDLENAGLLRLTPHTPEGIRHAKSMFGDRQIITKEEFSQWQDVMSGMPPRGERGSIDPGLLMRLGALGLGGFLGSKMTEDNPLVGGGAGALAVLAAGRSKGLVKSLKGLGQHALTGMDYGLGLGLTRLENIHPALRWRAVKFERDTMLHAHELLGRVDKFLVGLEKLPSAQKKDLGLELRSEDPTRIADALKRVGSVELVKGWGELQRVMKELGAGLKEKGFLKELGEIYLPRIVKDRAGLLKELEAVVNETRAKGGKPAIDLELKNNLAKRLHDANNDAIQTRGYGLNDIEESAIIGRYLREFIPGYGQPGFAKARHIKEITERLEPFYAGLAESVHSYVKSAVNELEKAKFFGDDLRMRKKGGQQYIHEDASIQSLLQSLLKKGQITEEQFPEIRDLLKSRFRMKETGPLVQGAKDLGYMALLSDAGAAVMQSGDSLMAVYHHGLRPMLEGLVRSLTGQKFVDWREFGGADLISAEFANTRTTSRWLNKVMKPMFFQVDLLGKNVNLNAAAVKLRGWAQSEAGLAKLQERFGKALSADEYKQLVGDLKGKRDTDLLRQVLFSELSRAQPVSKFDLPQAYQAHPNGRLLYQMHLWQLKQFDIARRDAYNEIRRGNLKKGLGRMTALLTVLGISGATSEQLKNFIYGRPLEVSLGAVMDNALRTFGWSQYMQEQLSEGQTQKAAGNVLLPVHLRIWDDIQRGGNRWLKYIPWIGRPLWERTEEGQAALAKQEAGKERRERLEGRMSSEEWRKRKEEARH